MIAKALKRGGPAALIDAPTLLASNAPLGIGVR